MMWKFYVKQYESEGGNRFIDCADADPKYGTAYLHLNFHDTHADDFDDGDIIEVTFNVIKKER